MLTVFLGKLIRIMSRLRGGSGSALPGLIVEKIDPSFMSRTLDRLPRGVVLISGTNGKTTTTKMVVELLEGQGLSVFTNRTGSNFTRGVAAALVGEVNWRGRMRADIAVLELDEAHAVHFVKRVKPSYVLLLNVMRDQLDRFGEIDNTAKLLEKIARQATHGVALNREDPRVRAIASVLKGVGIRYFGLYSKLRSKFPSDDDLHNANMPHTTKLPRADVTLHDFDDTSGTFTIERRKITTPLKVRGAYNIFNAAAAMSIVRLSMGEQLDEDRLIHSLSNVKPAFGRGESLMINDQLLDLVLVKNPSGFRLGLSSFDPQGVATMIAINDNYADGRDMSWLWDVEFDSLALEGVAMVGGVRAYDMALRLDYDKVPCAHVTPDLRRALSTFIGENKDKPKRIYCTYTAMLELRRALGTYTKIGGIDE